MKKLLFLVLLVCCGACNNEFTENSVSESNSDSFGKSLAIDPSRNELTSNDASTVAQMFSFGAETKTKKRAVKETIVVTDEEQEPAFYIVNYSGDEGFVIVSATKNYPPVLGYFESGNYAKKEVIEPLKMYLDEFRSDISQINTTVIDTLRNKFASEWVKYEQHDAFKSQTKSGVHDRQAAIAEWTARGYQCLSLGHIRYCLPAEEAEAFIADIVSQTPLGIDPMTESILLIKNENVQYGPLLSTKWGQGGDLAFNASNRTAGCVTVAVAQIMTHHRKPARFNWDLICQNIYAYSPEDTAIQNATRFLGVEVRDDLEVTYNSDGSTSSNILEAERVLDSYGYDARLYDYNIYNASQTDDIGREIAGNKPVYMRGVNINVEGHAWVCDGFAYSYTQYKALYLGGLEYPNYSEYTGVKKDPKIRYFHMNWGWNADCDGWLYSGSSNANNTRLNPPISTRSTGTRDFADSRKVLFIDP